MPVVIHDFMLKRTTGADGFVKDYLYEELLQLDAGRWFDAKFAGERIPSVEEVIELVRGRCMLNIEVKTVGDLYRGIDEKIACLIEKYDIHDEVYITSFDHHFVKRIKDLDNRLKTGLIMLGNPLLLKEQLKYADADMLSIHYAYLTHDIVSLAKSLGISLMAWTVDEEDMIKRVTGFSKDIMICSNYPDRVIECSFK